MNWYWYLCACSGFVGVTLASPLRLQLSFPLRRPSPASSWRWASHWRRSCRGSQRCMGAPLAADGPLQGQRVTLVMRDIPRERLARHLEGLLSAEVDARVRWKRLQDGSWTVEECPMRRALRERLAGCGPARVPRGRAAVLADRTEDHPTGVSRGEARGRTQTCTGWCSAAREMPVWSRLFPDPRMCRPDCRLPQPPP